MARTFTITQDGESRAFTIATGVGPAGATGATGPAPSGTGLVSVTAGVLDSPTTLSARVNADASNLRTQLGLGGASLLAVGTTAGTVAAGDDARITAVTGIQIQLGTFGDIVTHNSGEFAQLSHGHLLSSITGSIVTGLTVGSLEVGHASDTTLSRSAAGVLAVEGVAIPSISSTNTLTNKRIGFRITTIASSATPTVNTDNCDCVTITALAEAITSMTTNLSGTPTNFDQLLFRIKDDGTARAITWGASFAARGGILPTTTVASKVWYVLFVRNAVTATWDCVSSALEV